MTYHPPPPTTGAARTPAWRGPVNNGARASVRVIPASGTTACPGMLLAMYLDLAFRRVRLGPLGRLIVTAINVIAGAVDGLSSRLREPGSGMLFANYHVVAEVPR